ncbi:RES domain-containing protein [Bacillus thuringiensis]|uniref:RES domain-containing protein n=1 Tax=Bacillus thuringiensis TaxID=1428 RepID=UPI0035DCD286
MICMHCYDYEKVLAAEKILTAVNENQKFDKLIGRYIELNDYYEKCENCDWEIEKLEPIIEDDQYFFDELLELVGNSISHLIVNCEYCSEQDEMISRTRYIFSGKDEGDDEIRERILNCIPSGKCVLDFIQEVFSSAITESEMEGIASNLVCKGCNHGAGVSYGDKMDFEHFDLYDTVYTQHDNNNFFRGFYGEDIPELLTLLAESFSIEQLTDLKENFENSIHCTDVNFKKLIELVKAIREETVEVKPIILSEGRYVYHARKHSIQERPYSDSKIWAAPYGFSSNGRYNTVGSKTFYTSNSYLVLPKELRKQAGEQLTVGIFELQEDKVLLPVDSLFSGSDYYKFISEIPDNNNNATVKKEYSITNLIYLAAINANFDGIVYKSVQDNSYLNYLLFNVVENEDLELIAKFES